MTASNSTNPLDLAYEAGAILLENGAEISRVEGTMRRIAGHFGVEDESFFVLSNGIIAAGDGYARSKFIPIRGASLDKVVAVNQLSREVEAGQCTLEQIEERLQQIRAMKPKRAWEQILASGVGSAAFCILFGGGFADCLASFIAGLLLWVFVLFNRFQTPFKDCEHRHRWFVVVNDLLWFVSYWGGFTFEQHDHRCHHTADSWCRLHQRDP